MGAASGRRSPNGAGGLRRPPHLGNPVCAPLGLKASASHILKAVINHSVKNIGHPHINNKAHVLNAVLCYLHIYFVDSGPLSVLKFPKSTGRQAVGLLAFIVLVYTYFHGGPKRIKDSRIV